MRGWSVWASLLCARVWYISIQEYLRFSPAVKYCNFLPRISGEQIIWGGEIMVAAFGGGQLELQKLQFMIGRGFPSITRIEINRYDIRSFWSQLPFFSKFINHIWLQN